jgi:O-antigen/teichoic acid export membrane protein
MLAPQDFGLMALVVAIIAFAQIFSDMGVSNAIIHYQVISHEELSSLFWLNILAGSGIMVTIMLASPLFAWVYHEPRLQPVLICVSVSFLIAAVGQQLQVLAEKQLLFSALARLELASAAAGFAVAVAVAFSGGGVYALVAGMLVSAVVGTVAAWVLFAHGWRPLWRLRLGEVRRFLGFGAYMMGNNLLNSLNMQADLLVGGRTLSAGVLGSYSLPRDLCLRIGFVINPIVTRVGFPVMAKVQEERSVLKDFYLKTIRMTASVNFPIYSGLFIFAPELVRVLFGDQWLASVPLLRILALWGLVRSTGSPVGILLLAAGRADLSFRWNCAIQFLFLPVLWVGSHHGVQGLACALLAFQLCMVVPLWFILVRPLCGAGVTEYFRQIVIPLALAGLAVFVGFVVALPLTDPLSRCAAGISVGGVAYLCLSRYLNRPWFDAMQELVSRR